MPEACPKCGGAGGYLVSLQVSGRAVEWWEWNGDEVERLEGEDQMRYKEPKTVRCLDCNARVPNPNLST